MLQAHCQNSHNFFPRASPAEEQRELDPTCVLSGPGLEEHLHFEVSVQQPISMHLVSGLRGPRKTMKASKHEVWGHWYSDRWLLTSPDQFMKLCYATPR